MADEFINEALDWDSEIEDDGSGGVVILPEGDYTFTVKEFKKGQQQKTAKLPACPKAELTLEVKTESGTALCFENLPLCKSMEWKMSSFMRAIGQKKHGERLRPNWNKVLNATGKAHFKPATYTKDGAEKQKNIVDRYIDSDGKTSASAPEQPMVNIADGIDEEIPFG